jgi:carbamoyltransferase
MNILGISAGFHDAAVTSIKDSEIVFAGHAERYSKIKHDSQLNELILQDAISRGYPDKVAYYERPWVKKTRQLYSGQYKDVLTDWSVSGMLKRVAPDLNLHTLPVKTFNHHLSHAAAGFQTSPFNEATVVVIDAIGEWDTISIWKAEYDNKGNAQYKKVWGQYYPHSIGLMYSAFTHKVGLRPMDEEYILMGMSGYSDRYNVGEAFRDWLLESEFKFKFKHNLHIGLPEQSSVFGYSYLSEYDIARGAQVLVEQMIEDVISHARNITESNNLVYMGGVALNCLANRHLGHWFDNIWIMPNPGDAGSSLGAAALAYGKRLHWKDSYLGHTIPGKYPVADIITELLDKKIVGVANGPAEFGPRALGNRSLLADPRGSEIKDRVNEIKRRQKFRPFAPVILEECVHEYFKMPKGFKTSPYMQTVAVCLKPQEFPAIIHVDGTSRVQTVPKDCRSGIRQLLEAWYVWTDCPMLLNTSLNIRGEPMVNDRADADRFEQLYGVKVLS